MGKRIDDATRTLQSAYDGQYFILIDKAGIGSKKMLLSLLAPAIGSSSITTLGTIAEGTWHGAVIADLYISSAATWSAKQSAITTGTTSQYFRGDLSLATFPDIPTQYTDGMADARVVAGITGKQNTITTGTTSQYFRGDLSLATFPTLFSGSYADLTNIPVVLNPTGWAEGKVLKFNATGELVVGTDIVGEAGSGIALTDLGATSPISYNNTTGVFSVATGYTIPSSVEKGNYDTAYGWGNHATPSYWKSTNHPTTIAGYGILDANSGTVTSFSAGDLSPLFTTSEATATTTPALTFTLDTQTANKVFASPNGVSGTPTFRLLVAADLPNTTVTPNTYTNSTITVDAQGRITSASSGGGGYTLPIASTTVLGGVMVDGTSITINGSGVISAPGAGGGTVTSVTGAAPVVSSGGTTPEISMAAATSTVNGYMTSTYASKLDGIAAGSEVNVNADWNSITGDSQILNKPTIPTTTSQLTNNSGFLTAETDPVFSAWNKSTGISIPSTQISDWATATSAFVTGTPWTSMGYLTSQTSHSDVVVDGDFISQGIMLRGATSGTYSILTDSSANWNTAYSWGNHAGLYAALNHGDHGLATHASLSDAHPRDTRSQIAGSYEPAFTKNTGFNKNFGTAAGTVTQGNDSRLSDARTPLSHVHGNITNTGYLGITANIPLITGTSGIIQAGSFGTAANTFCQGNDSRLSDARIASDVYSWAKASTKPTYTYSEVGAEPAFTKNTGFNKNFGTTSGTVVQGNDSRLGLLTDSGTYTYVSDIYENFSIGKSTNDGNKLEVWGNMAVSSRLLLGTTSSSTGWNIYVGAGGLEFNYNGVTKAILTTAGTFKAVEVERGLV